MLNKLKPIIGRILFSATIPLITIIYVLLNHYRPDVHEIKTFVDTIIPFNRFFAVPYLFMFPYITICLFYFAVVDYKTYFKLLASDLCGMMICYIIFYIFPTIVKRPAVPGNDIFVSMMHYIYNENPYNCFPSIHVLSACLPLFFAFKYNKSTFIKIFTLVGSISISVSTLFVKQHYVLDLVAAVLLAVILYLLFTNDYLLRISPFKKAVNFLIPPSLKRPFMDDTYNQKSIGS